MADKTTFEGNPVIRRMEIAYEITMNLLGQDIYRDPATGDDISNQTLNRIEMFLQTYNKIYRGMQVAESFTNTDMAGLQTKSAATAITSIASASK